jgi:ATP-dependent Clp protease ATP-binding subunit ClpC
MDMTEAADDFTWGARRVLVLAEDAARQYGRPYMGAEHLLLGIVDHADGTGGRVLRRAGVTPGQVRAAVEMLTRQHPVSDSPNVPLNARAARVLALADDEARARGHRRVGSGHILLGLIREGEGIPAGILASMGVHDLARMREAVAEVDQPPLL